ncbi:hypothetical protein PPERSA_08903 [Pseudocohnilembus persalinus]|uniref:Uncharacterized protein n=1 Tax=Pseudocohnilembus persalinus TaxID=266149 RepID=A0A0V0R2Q3_PSEPJ|nr:hypothetical protein PPERSA_08903 [Pseudocohnilembus persalinus]|eukprot:KRX08799.1 hypothetical protein PPERSA_08903 [Pseudocohnilembus persalinus]
MVRIDFDGQISGKVENGQVFIGESLQMIIVPIGLGRQYQINNIFYYYNYEIIQAPSWLDFDPVQSLIYITVDNQGLTDGLEFQNNLIFTEIQLQVTSKLFIDNDIPLTESDGDKIIKDSIKNGYLTNGGYLTEKFYPNQDLFNYNDSFYTDQVLSKIIEVFSGSVFNIPAKFTISNSMFFDPSQTEPLMVLDTYSSQIEIIVEIQDTSKALFVEKNYIGATVILSDAHDYLAIKGDSTLAIQNMVNDMRIQNYTENLNEIKLNFIFDDYLNFQQKYRNIPFTDYQFLKLHEGVSINEAIPIQDQFNQIYADGKVTIEEDFTFQFQEDSFISPAGIELKYQFQMETEYGNGKYANFPQDFWLVTNPVDRRISGTPPQMKIYTKQRIKVTASDGYSTCDAYFLIKIWNFSFFNVILDIMEYAGPILFVLGVWSYKYTLYKIFFPKKYKYTEEVAIVGMEYKKVIPLMQDNLQKGIFLFNLLDLKKDFYQFWTEFGDINKEQLMSLIRHEAEKNPKLIQKNQIDIRDLQKKDSKLTMVIIGLGAIWVMKNQHKHTYKAFQELEKYGKQRYNEIDWFKKFVHITYPDYDEADEANDSEEDQFFSELEVNEEIQVGDNQIHGGFYNKEVVKQQIEQNLNKFNNDSVQMKKNINNTQKIFTNPNLKNDQKKGTVHASYHYHPKNFPILHIFDNILIEFFKQRKIALEQEIQECIYASVFGISFEKFYFPAVSKGINSIMGYERITEPSCLEDGYEQCGLKTNQPLPSWLKVTISNGLIILQGTPKVSNKGQYKIEIYHDCGVILQHHKISVQSNKVNKRESEELIENLNQYQSQIEEVATQVGNNKLQHDIQIEKTSMNKVQNDKNNQDQFNSNKELISQKRTSAIFETNQQIYINEYTYQDDASQSDFIGSQNYIFQNKNRLSNNKYVENIQTNNFVSESAQHTERKNKKYAPITTVIDKQIIDDVQ